MMSEMCSKSGDFAKGELKVRRLCAAVGKHYEYQLFPALGHNTVSSDDKKPVKEMMEWMKNVKILKGK